MKFLPLQRESELCSSDQARACRCGTWLLASSNGEDCTVSQGMQLGDEEGEGCLG
jgi:hypothetical protein